MKNEEYLDNDPNYISDASHDLLFYDDYPFHSIDPIDGEIENFCKNAIIGAENYFKYLKAAKRGREVIRVLSIAEIGDQLFELRLDRRIFSQDSVVFCASPQCVPDEFFENKDERYIDGKYIRICKYDKLVPCLCVDVKDDFIDVFRKLRTTEMAFVSDLTFLVQNVQKWYKKFGYMIEYPHAPNILNISDSSSMYTRGCESEAQLKAEQLALTSPISYIWGAPGTGKSQIVLANCIITYIDRNLPVYIVGPTNNAIEQVLRAVIKALQDQGRSIDCLYRLGMSSEEFLQQYARICERFDVQAEITSIEQEISILEARKEELRRAKELSSVYHDFGNTVSQYLEFAKREQQQKCYIGEIVEKLHRCSEDLVQLQNAYSTERNILSQMQKQQSSASSRIRRAFSFNSEERIQAQAEINAQKESAQIIKQKVDNAKTEKASLQRELSCAKNAISAFDQSRNRYIQKFIKFCLLFHTDYTSIDGTIAFYKTLKKPTSQYDEKSINKQIQKFNNRIRRINELRCSDMEKKLVFAFTVDYMVSHYEALVNPVHPAHIFLDEAAYCPMIKAGVLFAFGAPVTLLGDHMQLPPICEANEKLILSPDTNIFLWAQSSIYFSQIFEPDMSMNRLFLDFVNQVPPSDLHLPISPLTKTYRFGCDLARILDKFVYKNGFDGNEKIDTSVIVVDAPASFEDRNGRENKAEVRAILQYIEKFQPQDYAILTPYHAQVDSLRTVFGKDFREKITTIHKSQGMEWDTVILSVSDNVKNKFFTNTTNKKSNGLQVINTAVSRARKEIVIVCDYSQWSALSDKQLIGGMIALPSNKFI